MALTLEAENRLEDAGLIKLFDADVAMWTNVAKRAYDFVQTNFPLDAKIRHDDVAKALIPIIEVNEKLSNYLKAEKIRGKFWKQFFADLVTDRTWTSITSAS